MTSLRILDGCFLVGLLRLEVFEKPIPAERIQIFHSPNRLRSAHTHDSHRRVHLVVGATRYLGDLPAKLRTRSWEGDDVSVSFTVRLPQQASCQKKEARHHQAAGLSRSRQWVVTGGHPPLVLQVARTVRRLHERQFAVHIFRAACLPVF